MSFSISGVGGCSAPQITSGASAYASPTAKMSSLFQQIDSGNSGSITQAQFQQAFAALNPPASFQTQGAGATFSQLDPNGTGSVSKPDFVSGMTAMMRAFRGGSASGASATSSASSGSDAASQSLSDSLQSFLQLGSQGEAASNNNGVGGILDAWA